MRWGSNLNLNLNLLQQYRCVYIQQQSTAVCVVVYSLLAVVAAQAGAGGEFVANVGELLIHPLL